MTLRAARIAARGSKEPYLTVSKDLDIGWYTESQPTERTVFYVYDDGVIVLHNSDFAKSYKNQYLAKMKLGTPYSQKFQERQEIRAAKWKAAREKERRRETENR